MRVNDPLAFSLSYVEAEMSAGRSVSENGYALTDLGTGILRHCALVILGYMIKIRVAELR